MRFRRPGRFERRLLVALVLFSLVPAFLLLGTGTMILREAVSLQTTPAGWERLGESGRDLLERAEASGDPRLREAAERHRTELTTSIQQAQRWGYLNRRALAVIPWLAAGFFAGLLVLAVRSARRIARGFARPIGELVDWSGRVARGEPLPEGSSDARDEGGEFGVLRRSFRRMAEDLELSRMREVEAERVRASIAIARGVAHELKNALTPLRLALRALQANRTLDPAAREPLEIIEEESLRLEGLARAFAQLGRPPDGPMSAIDLVEMLQHLARTHLPPRVVFDLAAPEDLPEIPGYHDPLARAFGNLILNAVEAMEGEGALRVELVAADDRVEVRIRDTGPGLPVDPERIWDPDFTTKTRGTGLGLALVRQTVLAHGGEITARTDAGGGAEFRVRLPAPPTPQIREREPLAAGRA